MDYKPIGDLRAFVGNTSFEFAYIGGVFGDTSNVTRNTLTFNNDDVSVLGNIGNIREMSLLSSGIFMLRARVTYINKVETKRGTLAVYRKLITIINFRVQCHKIVMQMFPGSQPFSKMKEST